VGVSGFFRCVLQDLTYQKQISLTEALTGCEFAIRHLDNRVIRVRELRAAFSGCHTAVMVSLRLPSQLQQ
jgi:DnaJ-class molecular chaperone